MTREYVYAGGALLASISATTTTYYLQDHLSNRLVTDSTGAVTEQLATYPYGESWYNTSSEKWLFTSYERDAESGNDYAMARYDVNRFGRFSSPDALGGSALDPQSLNRYAYTRNDPVNAADPSGMLMIRGYGFVSWGDTGFGSNWGEFIESSFWGQTYSKVGNEIIFGAPTLYDEFYWIDFGPGAGAVPTDDFLNATLEPVLLDRLKGFSKTHCAMVFSAVIPHFSTASLVKKAESLNFYNPRVAPDGNYTQDEVTGNNDPTPLSKSLALGVSAATINGGRNVQSAVLIGPGFSNVGGVSDGNNLLHELLHAYTGWGDSAIGAKFSAYGLSLPDPSDTTPISKWLAGDCH